MKRMQIQILGVSETRWTGSGMFNSDGYTVYYSGGVEHAKGVAVIISEEMNKAVSNFTPISDRMMLIQLQGKPVNLNIIQVYAPTADKSQTEIDEFYAQLSKTLNYTKKQEINFIIGDFNAKVGKGRFEDVVGEYGLGDRNERGEQLIEFCQENNLTICNTWYALPPRRLYTWRSPQDNPQHLVRNQIDFIVVNKRYRNCVKAAKTYPGADVYSDHILLCAKIDIRLKTLKKPQPQIKCNLEALRDQQTRVQTEIALNDRLQQLKQTEFSNINVDEEWKLIKNAAIDTMKETIERPFHRRKKQWMTDEILILMDERRKYKNNNTTEYHNINKKIKRKIKEAKEAWMAEQCKEIEELQQKNDNFHMHKKLKEAAGIYKNGNMLPTLRDENDNPILDKAQKIERWEHYVAEQFNDEDRSSNELEDSASTGPEILLSEVKQAFRQAKNGKAPGPDEITSELLKLVSDDNLKRITLLFNKIYETGNIPQEWLNSVFIPIPKKRNPKTCNDYRLISLMSHTLKALLKIIQNRIYSKCEAILDNKQFGFRSGLGTRDALFSMQVLLQRCWDLKQDVFICFIDFQRAFDCVRHDLLLDKLKHIGLDDKDIRLIRNLYWKQQAVVRFDNEKSNNVPIKKGVRQGCILSPTLFNIYSEYIFREALNEQAKGIKFNGHNINNIRYADDTALIAGTLDDLQDLLHRVNGSCAQFGLTINTNKTKFMIVSKTEHRDATLLLEEQMIQRVNRFTYLGSSINDKVDPDEEVRSRIGAARTAFIKFRPILCNRSLNIESRLRFLKCYVWSTLLYGVESWTLKVITMNKLEAFEMWCFRRMLRISWTSRTTNEEVLRLMKVDRQLIQIIKRRKLTYMGHIIRGEKYLLLQIIIEGKIEGKRGVGRRKMSWYRNIKQWTGMTFAQLCHTALDRERFNEVIANL